MTEYQRWCSQKLEDPDLTAELQEIAGNEEEINDRFYRSLAFGTAGLRGVLGCRHEPHDIYTSARQRRGLANYLNASTSPAAVRALPSRTTAASSLTSFRRRAPACSRQTASRRTCIRGCPRRPTLSFAVRYLHTDAGINVTASHNPAKYNGYKVYGSDGCQITAQMPTMSSARSTTPTSLRISARWTTTRPSKEGLIVTIPDEVQDAFLDAVYAQRILDEPCDNLHGRLHAVKRHGPRLLHAHHGALRTSRKSMSCPSRSGRTATSRRARSQPGNKEALQKGLELCEKDRRGFADCDGP